MRMFTGLPFSLIFTTLVALVATAVPVRADDAKEPLFVLGKDNFDEVTAKGVWFIEHFSPYCTHCKSFEPTWRKLVKEIEAQSDPGIKLAQVNCVIDGDLCDAHKVKGYPTINLYRNGEYVEQYKKARDLPLLLEYTSLHAEKKKKAPAATPTPPKPLEPKPKADPAPEKHTPAQDWNPSGTVTVLTPSNFHSFTSKGPVFVKFYAPWCGHCKKLAPHWTRLAEHMRHKMTIAEMDCDAHSKFCQKQNVEGFPALFFYPGPEADRSEYMGGRKFEHLSAFAEKATEPPVRTIAESELDAEIKEHEVMFLFVQTTPNAEALNSLTIAAQSLLGSAPVLTTTSAGLSERFSIVPGDSVLFVFRDHVAHPADRFVAYSSSHGDTNGKTRAAYSAWLQAHKLPSALELVADSFQAVMNAPHAPLVVLTAVPKEGELGRDGAVTQVREIARQWREESAKYPGKHVQFVWMDGSRWASWLKSQYGIRSDALPETVLARHKDLIYWDTDEAGKPIQLSSASVFSAIEGALHNRIPYKNSQNIVERMAKYLSAKLSWVEDIFFANLWRAALSMVALIALIVWGMLRLLDEGVPLTPEQRVDIGGEKRRTGRVD